MQVSPKITLRDMEPSPALEAAVREKMGKLERFYDRIIACHVVIEAPHRRHHQGRLYGVRIDITLPQGQVVVSHDRQRDHAHEDVYVALRDAFDAAYRQLEDYHRRQDGEVKTHVLPSAGEVISVISVMADKGYGFIRSLDGHEVYFHENSVLDNAFARLVPGSAVRFVEGGIASTLTNDGDRPFHELTIVFVNQGLTARSCSCNGGPAEAVCECPNAPPLPGAWEMRVGQVSLKAVTLAPGATYDDDSTRTTRFLVAVTPFDMMDVSIHEPKNLEVRLPEGQFHWLAPGPNQIQNIGSQPMRFVSVEFYGTVKKED